MTAKDWKTEGIRVVTPMGRTLDTPDTRGMNRQAAISGNRTGSQALWAGTNHIRPGTITGPHHHGRRPDARQPGRPRPGKPAHPGLDTGPGLP